MKPTVTVNVSRVPLGTTLLKPLCTLPNQILLSLHPLPTIADCDQKVNVILHSLDEAQNFVTRNISSIIIEVSFICQINMWMHGHVNVS